MKNTFAKMFTVCALAGVLGVAFTGCGEDSSSTRASGSYAGRTVTIGNQVWMAENLNIDTEDSWCYDNNPEMCAKYGRLYTWEAAMKACPSGWRLPSHEDWMTLFDTIDETGFGPGFGMDVGGIKLKCVDGWEDDPKVTKSEDVYGFSAFPAGEGEKDGEKFHGMGRYTKFWSTEEKSFSEDAYAMVLSYNHDEARYLDYKKTDAYSVRCVKDSD